MCPSKISGKLLLIYKKEHEEFKMSYAGFRLTCRIAALMMILVQLRKRHLPQRDDQAASSVKPIDR